jgi:hypothetical protein
MKDRPSLMDRHAKVRVAFMCCVATLTVASLRKLPSMPPQIMRLLKLAQLYRPSIVQTVPVTLLVVAANITTNIPAVARAKVSEKVPNPTMTMTIWMNFWLETRKWSTKQSKIHRNETPLMSFILLIRANVLYFSVISRNEFSGTAIISFVNPTFILHAIA